MTRGLRVGLLFGGGSVEHEVSVVSARGVVAAMRRTAHECVPLAVTGDGHWLSAAASAAVLDGEAARVEAPATGDDGVRVGVRPGAGLVELAPGRAAAPLRLDVVFPLIHGRSGEDGRLQGTLELAGVPYVGSGVLGSAAAMDKAVTKRLAASHGIDVVPWVELSLDDLRRDALGCRRRVAEELGFPVFVKPCNGGSSVGISRVAGADALEAALRLAGEHDRTILIERGIAGRELECAVLGNGVPEASGVGEILPKAEFYDYRAKYLDDSTGLEIPARLEPQVLETVQRTAIAAYRALGLCGFARVDFLLERAGGRLYLNEINTLPGFTPISMFPKLWEAAGLAYPALIERLVALALERGREERSVRSRRD